MAGPLTQFVTFIYTGKAEVAWDFYENVLGLEVVLDQGACHIYRVAGEAFLGVCTNRQPESRDAVCVTFVTDDVDGWYEKLTAKGVVADAPPILSERFGIYHFFFRDPDGHRLEVQQFRQPSWPKPGA